MQLSYDLEKDESRQQSSKGNLAKYLTTTIGGDIVFNERYAVEAWMCRVAPGPTNESGELMFKMGSFFDFEQFSVNGMIDHDFLSTWRAYRCGIQKPIRDDVLINLQYFYEQMKEEKTHKIEITAAKTFNQS